MAPLPQGRTRRLAATLASGAAALAGDTLVLRLPAAGLLALALQQPRGAPVSPPTATAEEAVAAAAARWDAILGEARRLVLAPLPVVEGPAPRELFETLDEMAGRSFLAPRVSIAVLNEDGEPHAWSSTALDPQPDLLDREGRTGDGPVFHVRRTMAAIVLGVTARHPGHTRTVDVILEPSTPLSSPLPPIFSTPGLGGRTPALQYVTSTAAARAQERLFLQRGEPFRTGAGDGAVLYAPLRDGEGQILGIVGIPESVPAPVRAPARHDVALRVLAIALALAIFARALGTSPERSAAWIAILGGVATAATGDRAIPSAAVAAAFAGLALVLDGTLREPAAARRLLPLLSGVLAALVLRTLPRVLPDGPGMDALTSLDPIGDVAELRPFLVPVLAWGVTLVALQAVASRGTVAVRIAVAIVQAATVGRSAGAVPTLLLAWLPLALGGVAIPWSRARSSLARALLVLGIGALGAATGQLAAVSHAGATLADWLSKDVKRRVEELPERRAHLIAIAAQRLSHSYEPATLASTGGGGDERAYALWLGSGLADSGVDSAVGLFSAAGDLVGSFSRNLPRSEVATWDPDLGEGTRRTTPFESFDRSALRTGVAAQVALPNESGIPGLVRVAVATDLSSLKLPKAHRFSETVVARMTEEGRSLWSSNGRAIRIDPARAGGWSGQTTLRAEVDGGSFLGIPVLVRDQRLFIAVRRPSRLQQASTVIGAGLLGALAVGALVVAGLVLRRLDAPRASRDGTDALAPTIPGEAPRGLRERLLPLESLRALRSYRVVLLGAFLVATLLPAQILGLALDGILRERFTALRVGDARRTIDVARRTAAELFWGETVLVDADEKAELVSRLVDAPIDIYEGGQLVGTSRRQIVDVGLMPRLLAPAAHVAVSLEGRPLFVWQERPTATFGTGRRPRAPSLALAGGEEVALWAAAPVALGSAIRRGVVTLPLPAGEGEVEEQLAAIAAAVRVVAFALMALSIGLATVLARGLSRPLTELTHVADALRHGAVPPPLGLASEEGTFRELATLGAAMHRMAGEIHERERALIERNRYIETVLDNATPSVLSTDGSGTIRTANRSARELLGIAPGPLDAAKLDLAALLAADPALRRVSEALAQHRRSQSAVQVECEVARESVVRLRVSLLPFGADGGTIAILEDVSDVARANRIAAWAEMARSVAHEIKNPLTPIRLQTEHLRRVASVAAGVPPELRAAMAQATGVILDQVDALKRIASEFSRFARPSEERPVPVDLAGILQRTAGAYAAEAGTSVDAAIPAALPSVRGVAADLERAFKNLLQNAYESLQRLPPGAPRRITVEAAVREAGGGPRVVVVVADSGAGVPAELRGRIFEPYFSTKDAGSGLGLALTRKILLEHGGDVRLLPSDRGARFEVDLPAAP